jgi:hypothetical protein
MSASEERFTALREALSRQADVTSGRMFGSEGLKTNGKVFALLTNGRLVLKLPAVRVDELIVQKAGERFDPGHGRLMREWISIAPRSRVDWHELAEEARRFVHDGSREDGGCASPPAGCSG